eukprot:5725149-Prymnesium_polylepis.2
MPRMPLTSAVFAAHFPARCTSASRSPSTQHLDGARVAAGRFIGTRGKGVLLLFEGVRACPAWPSLPPALTACFEIIVCVDLSFGSFLLRKRRSLDRLRSARRRLPL